MNTLPEIIGIAGTNGAGKDTLGNLRLARLNARKVGLSDILRVEADKRGLSHERANLSAISTEMGIKLGAGALLTMTLLNFQETRRDDETGLSIVSVRRPAEAKVIQEAGGALVWIDADREVRYQRILEASRGRVDDMVSFGEFSEQEDREMHPKDTNPSTLNMAGVRDMSDFHVVNEFGSESEFEDYLTDKFGLPPRAN